MDKTDLRSQYLLDQILYSKKVPKEYFKII